MMKMLMIVFRESIAHHVQALLKEHAVTGYTEFHNVEGKGESGPAVKAFLSPGANGLILAAMSESAAYRLIDGFTRFSREHAAESTHPLPLHIFTLPCEQVL